MKPKRCLPLNRAKSWEDYRSRTIITKTDTTKLKRARKKPPPTLRSNWFGFIRHWIKTRRAHCKRFYQLHLSEQRFRALGGRLTPRQFSRLPDGKRISSVCNSRQKSPLPLHFVALERVATTHWQHVESKAEHGFNLVSYCLNFRQYRKCKYALRQVFPCNSHARIQTVAEVTLHAATAFHTG